MVIEIEDKLKVSHATDANLKFDQQTLPEIIVKKNNSRYQCSEPET